MMNYEVGKVCMRAKFKGDSRTIEIERVEITGFSTGDIWFKDKRGVRISKARYLFAMNYQENDVCAVQALAEKCQSRVDQAMGELKEELARQSAAEHEVWRLDNEDR